jgi:hypothetical protein
MQGIVMAFSGELRAGYICGEDGEQYLFSDCHWHVDELPRAALKVCFDAVCGEAMNVTKN